MRCAPTTPTSPSCGRRCGSSWRPTGTSSVGSLPSTAGCPAGTPRSACRLADAGFVGLTIPAEYGGRGRWDLSAPLRRDRGTARPRRPGRGALDRRPQVAPGLLAYGTEEQRRRLLPRIAAGRLYSAIGMSEHGAGSDLAAVADQGDPHRRRLAAQRHQGLDQRRASRPSGRRAGPHQPAGPRASARRLQPVHRADRPAGRHDQPHRADERRAPLQRGAVRRRPRSPTPTCSARSATGGTRSPPSSASNAAGRNASCPPRRCCSRSSGRCGAGDVDDRTAADVGDLVARMISLRQLSVSVARALTDGPGREHPGGPGQGSRHPVRAGVRGGGRRPDRRRRRTGRPRGCARCWPPRGCTRRCSRCAAAPTRCCAAWWPRRPRREADDVRRRTEAAGRRHRPPVVRRAAGTPRAARRLRRRPVAGAGDIRADPADQRAGCRTRPKSAVVLGGLARHAAAVPIAETDLLAAWLAAQADLPVPADGPLTVAIADVEPRRRPDRRHRASTCRGPRVGPVAAGRPDRRRDRTSRCSTDGAASPTAHNLAGEPRGDVDVRRAARATVVGCRRASRDELVRRGAWARCVQIVGAFDAARAADGRAHRRTRRSSAARSTLPGRAALTGRADRRGRERPRRNGFGDRRGGRPRLRQRAGRLRGDGGEGRGRPSRRPGDHDRPPAARRDRRHDRTPAVAGDDAGAKLGRRVRHDRQSAKRLGRMALAAEDVWSLVVGPREPN